MWGGTAEWGGDFREVLQEGPGGFPGVKVYFSLLPGKEAYCVTGQLCWSPMGLFPIPRSSVFKLACSNTLLLSARWGSGLPASWRTGERCSERSDK